MELTNSVLAFLKIVGRIRHPCDMFALLRLAWKPGLRDAAVGSSTPPFPKGATALLEVCGYLRPIGFYGSTLKPPFRRV